MAKLIPIGTTAIGQTRRFANLGEGKFLYSCPMCNVLAANDEEFCRCGGRPAASVTAGEGGVAWLKDLSTTWSSPMQRRLSM